MMPQKSTRRLGAITSGTVLAAAARTSSFVGLWISDNAPAPRPYGWPNLPRYSAETMKALTISARLTRASAVCSLRTSSPGRLKLSSFASQKS